MKVNAGYYLVIFYIIQLFITVVNVQAEKENIQTVLRQKLQSQECFLPDVSDTVKWKMYVAGTAPSCEGECMPGDVVLRAAIRSKNWAGCGGQYGSVCWSGNK